MKCWQLDRTVALAASSGGGGKSELRRAVCRITSGRVDSSPLDGKCHRKHTASSRLSSGCQVRVKRCGKSAPPPQQCGGQGKPHTEQDQIGRDLGFARGRAARRVKPPGRSLEPRSNARPRGMTVLLEQSGRQNSAYRSGCHNLSYFLPPNEGASQIVTPV